MDLGPKAEMREIRTSGLMSGIWKRNGIKRHRARSRLYQTWQVCEKVTGRKLLGKQLAAAKAPAREEYRSSRLTPTNVGAPCAFLTGP